jgi:Gram-negative bacterial TonB protein C-terminal
MMGRFGPRSCSPLCAVAAFLASGCASAARSAANVAKPASGFSWTNDDLIVADTAVGRRLIEGRAPRYPAEERLRGGEAGFLAAFVLDTTGRVELPSVSFIGTAPDPFARAACNHFRSARFTPVPQRAGIPVRALVVTDLVFAVEGGSWYGKTLDATPARERFRQEGAAKALAEMKPLQHCPP